MSPFAWRVGAAGGDREYFLDSRVLKRDTQGHQKQEDLPLK